MLKKKFLCSGSQPRFAILGAGISGLSSAYYLKKKYGSSIDLTLFEKEERVGGWIRTRNVEGFLFEGGARSIRLQDGEATLDLIRDLGLEDQLLFASKAAKNRYLLFNGKLEKILSLPLMKGILPGLLNDLFASKSTLEDESVYAFFSRRFSPLIADRFIDPLIKGIYAGDPKRLSIKACFPQIKDRSLILGGLVGAFKKKKRGIVTLRGGMEELTRSLRIVLKDEIKFGITPVLKEFDHVISALPSYALAEFFPETHFQKLLNSIPFATVGVVHLGYRKQVHQYQGFGYLVPSSEKEEILGVIFDSSVFPEQNPHPEATRLTVMIGGEHENLEEIAKNALKRHLGISAEPDVCFSSKATQAIPQYPIGFPSLLDEINKEKENYPNLYLLGTSFHGVSVNKAIASAKKLSFQKFAI